MITIIIIGFVNGYTIGYYIGNVICLASAPSLLMSLTIPLAMILGIDLAIINYANW